MTVDLTSHYPSSIDVPGELIKKYAVQGPRYTSYPTAVEFSDNFTNRDWQLALNSWVESAPAAERNLSLYTHIPFCRSLCYFCACHKVITNDAAVTSPFLKSVQNEMRAYSQLLGDRRTSVISIHWGGGSPNFLQPSEMQQLFESTLAAWPDLASNAEVSIEVDPRTTSFEQLEMCRKLGFNRISLGVQDFATDVQAAINRIQPYEITQQLVQSARDLGFSGINLDLIYGLPGQKISSFQETLDRVLTIRPDRIALYGYAHVTWIKKVQKALERYPLPDSSLRIELFRTAVRALTRAGYIYIGMDHFALPSDPLSAALKDGSLSRNFMGYSTTRGAGTIGIGPSAISGLPDAFAQNEKDVAKYQSLTEGSSTPPRLPIIRGLRLSDDDRLRSSVIARILCQGCVDFTQFGDQWGVNFVDYFYSELQQLRELEDDGLLLIESHGLKLTELGRYFMRNVAMYFDSYLDTHLSSGRKVFSQTI